MKRDWCVPLLVLGLAGCAVGESPRDGESPVERSSDAELPSDNNAFGNVQPQHVRDTQHHAALRAYGSHALFVCNASLQDASLLGDLRDLVGPSATLLANDPSGFVPLWGEQSEFWNDYRAAMDPANVGLPDSAWYWIDESGQRRRAPMSCPGGGWCGEFWPGWALKPEASAYRAKAEFLAGRLTEFDGLWLDEWQAGFSEFQTQGLGLPPESRVKLSQDWIECRQVYFDHLRELTAPGFLLVPNLQPARLTRYKPDEMRKFDGHTAEFPDVSDLGRFQLHPSKFNVGWSGRYDLPGLVRMGYGLPVNVDP